jgi:NO-binding membrane sensor protein with MHYT domain
MVGTYDLTLVFASYCVAAAASYAALDLGVRISFFDGKHEMFWLCASALAMGTGIWSMHFVGMEAFTLPVPITYDLWLTLLSWAAAVTVSLLALYIISRSYLTVWGIGGGGAVMGIGVCIMHYSGMWAMQMTPEITYDDALFSDSVGIAVLASSVALIIGFSVRHLPTGKLVPAKILAALVMGGAICGMHYTGMAAARFAAGAVCAPGNLLRGNWMVWPVVAGTLLVLAAAISLSLVDLQMVERRRRVEQARMQTLLQREMARS